MIVDITPHLPVNKAAACKYYSDEFYTTCRGENDSDVCFACFFLKAAQYPKVTKKCVEISFTIMAYIFAILFLLEGNGWPLPVCAAITIVIGELPFGWIVLRRITPKMFRFLPGIGWVVWFCVKLVLSVLIGWIAAPVRIYRTVQVSKMLNNTKTIAEVK